MQRAPKKNKFLVKNFFFEENAFFGLLFQNFVCDAENIPKTGSIYCFERARKINLVDLKKKKVDKIFDFFFEIVTAAVAAKNSDRGSRVHVLRACQQRVGLYTPPATLNREITSIPIFSFESSVL